MPSRQPLVVVVEDDVDMNRAMESVLKAAGFEAATYFSGEALLEVDVPAEAACFVLDIHLPGMTGFQLYDRLVATRPLLPVIFMTAYDEPAIRRQAEQTGAEAYLTKPFVGKKLIEAVDRVTRLRTSRGLNPKGGS